MIDDILERFGIPRPHAPAPAPVTYEIGGGWGDKIEWFNADICKVVGWKRRIPRAGDVLLAPMTSGRTGRYRFMSVRPKLNPPDMFFAVVEFLGYEGAS